MNDSPNDNGQRELTGELFTRLYLQPGAPLQDCPIFRTRLDAYFETKHQADYVGISHYLKEEGGIMIPVIHGPEKAHYKFQVLFVDAPIERVLNAITLIWRYLATHRRTTTHKGDGSKVVQTTQADAWLAFVRRAFHEEQMAYTVDKQGGVHFVVDEEFERNRISALQCLGNARYSGVRAAFEAAHSYLDVHPADTKASVRSAFEALEILARLIDPASKNLNKWMVQNKLMPLAQVLAQDDIEKVAIEHLFEGVACLVDGLHNYRHGQCTELPVAPSLSMAVYVLSSVAASLRWLVLIDSQGK